MNQSIKNLFASLLLVLTVMSCNNEKSIQDYFVENQEKSEFLVLDLSPKMIDFGQANLSEEQTKIFNSFNKLNVLAYKITDDNKEQYTLELEKAKAIFANETYSELMEFSDSGIKFRISTVGDNEEIDEFLVLASSQDMGFGILRVLGDNMKPEKLYKLIEEVKNADIDTSVLENFKNYFDN